MKKFIILSLGLLFVSFLVPEKVSADPFTVFGTAPAMSVDVACPVVVPSMEVLTDFEFLSPGAILSVPVTVLAKSGLTLPFGLNWVSIISIILGIYEVLVRAIPSIGNNSAIHKVFEFLKWLSGILNVKKK